MSVYCKLIKLTHKVASFSSRLLMLPCLLWSQSWDVFFRSASAGLEPGHAYSPPPAIRPPPPTSAAPDTQEIDDHLYVQVCPLKPPFPCVVLTATPSPGSCQGLPDQGKQLRYARPPRHQRGRPGRLWHATRACARARVGPGQGGRSVGVALE